MVLEFGEQYKITYINEKKKKDFIYLELRKYNNQKKKRYSFLEMIIEGFRRGTCFVNSDITELRDSSGGSPKKILKIEKFKKKTKPINLWDVYWEYDNFAGMAEEEINKIVKKEQNKAIKQMEACL